MDDETKVAATRRIFHAWNQGKSRDEIAVELVRDFGLTEEQARAGVGYQVVHLEMFSHRRPAEALKLGEVARANYYGPGGAFLYSRSLIIGDVPHEPIGAQR